LGTTRLELGKVPTIQSLYRIEIAVCGFERVSVTKTHNGRGELKFILDFSVSGEPFRPPAGTDEGLGKPALVERALGFVPAT
jgi:hypothetical protein